MSERRRLLKSIAETIADYRAGEINPPTPEHVGTWIGQFEEAVQEPMLAELDHVLERTYISRVGVEKFLTSLAKNKQMVGDDSCAFWKDVKFLDIQGAGNSQREMLQMFSAVLQERCGLTVDECGGEPHCYLYLDDAIFTGNRVRSDVTSWIKADAPPHAALHIVTFALHRGGQYYATTGIEKAARDAKKRVSVTWWHCLEIEERRAYVNTSDVLRPTSVPDEELTRAYAQSLAYAPVLRKPGSVGTNRFFSSEEGRHLLEQELLKAGARIRSMCPYLNVYQRPLGNMVLETLGFGSLLVTFRNCPNNCPLAFWAGDPWYPLFPRKTN